MPTPLRHTCRSVWFVCLLLVGLAATNVWSDTDKTEVDLERGRPEAASRYHRPRAAHLYQYDKTAVDLAVPLVQQPSEEGPSGPKSGPTDYPISTPTQSRQPGASQRPGTLTPPVPAPTPPPPQAPPPGEGR